MKKEKLVDVWKTEADSSLTNADSLRKEKKEKLLREVIVKIRLKQDDDDDEIVVKALLNSGVTRLVERTSLRRRNWIDWYIWGTTMVSLIMKNW